MHFYVYIRFGFWHNFYEHPVVILTASVTENFVYNLESCDEPLLVGDWTG